MPEFYQKDLLKSQTKDEPLLTSPQFEEEHMIEPPHAHPDFSPVASRPQDNYSQPNDYMVKTLLTWTAPARPFRKKNRSFYTTTATLVVLICLILFFVGEFLLMGAVFALAFLVYVLNFVPPEDIEYKISTQGVTSGNHFYHWQQLDSFWISKKDGFTILHILTRIGFPGVLMLVLGEGISEDDIKMTCARYLPFHEIAPKNIMDKWSDSLQKYFPLENPNS